MLFKSLAGIAALVLLTPVSASAEEPPAEPASDAPSIEVTDQERVSLYVDPGIVFLTINWSGKVYDTFNKSYMLDDKVHSIPMRCTGYVVNPDGWIATAGHCVDPREVLDAFILDAATWAVETGYFEDPTLTAEEIVGFDIFRVDGERNGRPDREAVVSWGAEVSGLEEEESKPARVLKFTTLDQGDAALLKVEEFGLNALPLADAQEVQQGTAATTVGFPASVDEVVDANYTPTYKTGAVSAVRPVSNGLLSVYEMDAAMSPGMSGGPTVTIDGMVLGTNSFNISGETEAFNFVQPGARIQELLASEGVENELAPITQDYRAGIDAYFAGDKGTAVRLLTSVTQEQPANGLALDYLAKARDLPDPPKPADSGGGFNLMWVLLIAVLLVLAAIAVAAMLVLRKMSQSKRQSAPVGASVESGSAAHVSEDDAQPAQEREAYVSEEDAQPVQAQRAYHPTEAHTQPVQEQRACPSCGQPAGTTPFCPNCGRRLRESSQSTSRVDGRAEQG